MSEDNNDSDKQYEPSQKKLDDAREKGEVPKSTDLTTAAAYGGFLIVAISVGPASFLSLGSFLQGLLGQADSLSDVAFSGSQSPFMGTVLMSVAGSTMAWFLIPAVLALLSVLAQQGLVFAPTKLVLKGNRISPLSGIKNKFGRQGLFEFAKSLTKLIIFAVVTLLFLSAQRDRVLGSMHLSPGQITLVLGRMTITLMLIVFLVALVLGMIDLVWQRAEHTRKNRMSRQELMDEMKSTEGDPLMKQQRRQKGMSLAMNKMLAEVPTADVIIVNPTHYAVALKWSRTTGGAPVCVAKGVDEIAARIRELAIENAVPIHADPPTARALHAGTEIGDEIAPDLYRPVAAAIRFAEAMRKKAKR